MGSMNTMNHLLVLGAVLWVPVKSQQLFRQAGGTFPSLSSSFSFQQAEPQFAAPTAFLSGQSPASDRGENQRPFVPIAFRPQPTQQQQRQQRHNNANGGGGGHTYPDGSMGGDYPSKLAEKRGGGSGSTHTYPDGTMGGDYPSHLAAKNGAKRSGQHTYPDGSMGGDYPSHLAAKNNGASRSGQYTYPNGRMGGDYPSHLAAKNNAVRSGQHTYPDGSMGGDYPSHLAAKTNAARSGQHTYPDGSMGGDYPSHLAAKNNAGRSGQHTYPDDTTGGDYPSKVGARQGQQQQQYPNGRFRGTLPVHLVALQASTNKANSNSPTPVPHTYPDGTTGGDYTSRLAAQNKQHTYPDGTMGGDYPTRMAAQNKQHTYPDGTMGGDYPTRMATQNKQHTYPDGTMGGDYPTRMAAQNKQHTYPDGTMGGDYPTRMAAQNKEHTYPDGTVGGDYPTRMAAQNKQHTYPDGTMGGDYPTRMATQNKQHTYPDGTTGGDYPTRMAAQNKHQTYTNGARGGDYPSKLGGKSANTPAYPPQKFVPSNSQYQSAQVSSNNLRNEQLYPLSSAQNQLYSPTRANADTNLRAYPDTRVAVQRLPTKAIPQGRQLPRNAFDSHGQGSRPASTAFFQNPQSQGQSGNQQCFRYQDLAASYELSDVVNDYPMDAITSELHSNKFLAPMLGYENLPKTRSTSFSGFGGSLGSSFDSFGFENEKDQYNGLSSTQYFPANFDKHTLGQAMKPMNKLCPSEPYTLRTLNVDNNRCSVVNADYQAITYTKCLRRECNRCAADKEVHACVEHYNWVSVMIYCPHWQRNKRIRSVRLYLPQGCTCNQYQC